MYQFWQVMKLMMPLWQEDDPYYYHYLFSYWPEFVVGLAFVYWHWLLLLLVLLLLLQRHVLILIVHLIHNNNVVVRGLTIQLIHESM